jgi:hypothetical protein
VMLSYCWAQQEVILRVREALGSRNHRVWLDLEQMSGSTGQKTGTFPPLFMLNVIITPRQARDKRRRNSKRLCSDSRRDGGGRRPCACGLLWNFARV